MKYEYYNRACELLAKAGISDSDVQRLEHEFGYFSAPASKSHHLNTIGGLARHSINVTERLALDEFSLAIIATHTADILAARVDEKEVENA